MSVIGRDPIFNVATCAHWSDIRKMFLCVVAETTGLRPALVYLFVVLQNSLAAVDQKFSVAQSVWWLFLGEIQFQNCKQCPHWTSESVQTMRDFSFVVAQTILNNLVYLYFRVLRAWLRLFRNSLLLKVSNVLLACLYQVSCSSAEIQCLLHTSETGQTSGTVQALV